MIVAFCYGFFTAIIGIVAILIYGFGKLKQTSVESLDHATRRIQNNKARVDAAAKLDPIRLVSNPRLLLGTDEPQSGAPGADSGRLQWLNQAAWVHTRLVMVGTTITVYETLATSPDVTASSSAGGGASAPASMVTAERYLGKISTSMIAHRVLSVEELVCLFADSLALTAAAQSFPSSTGTAAAGGAASSPSSSAARHGMSAVVSAATVLHQALVGDADDTSITDKNAESWLKENVRDRMLFLEFVGGSGGGKSGGGAVDGGSEGEDGAAARSRSIFLQHNASSSVHLKPPVASIASRATCLVMWFPNRRDLDRWANVLSATERTYEWKQYVRTLPSLDVLNLLAARVFFENTSGPAFEDYIRARIEKKLNAVVLPKPLSGHVHVASLKVGGEVPLVHNVSFASFSTNGEIGFDFDLQYRGGFEVVFAASFYVKTIRVPQLLFHVHVLEIGGRMHVSIGPPPTNKLWIGFHTPPNVRLEFSQEVASHDGVLSSILSWIPDLSETISNFVKVEMFEDMLLPNLDDYTLPNIAASDAAIQTLVPHDASAADGHIPITSPSLAASALPPLSRSSATTAAPSPSAGGRAPSERTAANASGSKPQRHERVPSNASSIASSVMEALSYNKRPPSSVSPQARRAPGATTPDPDHFSVLSSGAMRTTHRPVSPSASSNDGSAVSAAAPFPSSSSNVHHQHSEGAPRPADAPSSSSSVVPPPAASQLRRRVMDDLRSTLKSKGEDVRRLREASPLRSGVGGTDPTNNNSSSSSNRFQQPQWNHPSF